MYGNQTLPGVSVSEDYRVTNGSIWQGQPEATWFKTVSVNGTDGAEIPAGIIMKEVIADGSYTPITTSDIVSAVADLPGARLAIVADKTAKEGTTAEVDGETENVPSTVLVGISGIVNKDLLYVGETKFTDLTDAQKIGLNLQLEAWNFQLVNVTQA
ncbi:MAG: hypothetical protein IJG36_11105 [Synergistaceae bacterium]|nr:hypothetical protein [Synergistaceae bacterium]